LISLLPSLFFSKVKHNYSTQFKLEDKNIETWSDINGKICAYGERIGKEFIFYIPKIGYYSFYQKSDVVTYFDSFHCNKTVVKDVFFRTIIPMYLNVNGMQTLHASGILTKNGVIALSGQSGVGKSTLAYELYKKGYRLWADDAVTIRIHKSRITSFQLPFTLRIKDKHRRIMNLNFTDGSNYHSFNKLKKYKVNEQINCIIELVRINTTNSKKFSIVKLNPGNALKSLIKHSYCFTLKDSDIKKKMIDSYLKVTKATAIYRLNFMDGKSLIPDIVNKIEQLAR